MRGPVRFFQRFFGQGQALDQLFDLPGQPVDLLPLLGYHLVQAGHGFVLMREVAFKIGQPRFKFCHFTHRFAFAVHTYCPAAWPEDQAH